mgnify:FL=1
MKRLASCGMRLMGWYPLGHGDPTFLEEPIFLELADKYRKSTVQIVLRWAVQRSFITIPGTKNLDHIRANFDIYRLHADGSGDGGNRQARRQEALLYAG